MTLGDDIEKLLGERMTDWQKELLKGGMIVDPNYAVPHAESPYDIPPITVNEIAGYFEVSRELLEFDETRTTPQPAPWHKRARWRWQTWRARAGVKVGSLIAGFDLSHDDCE